VGDVLYGHTLAQVEALQINKQIEPGLWSMAKTGGRLCLHPDVSHETRAIEIELYNVLPAPSDEVSLEDILLSKVRRKDELMALRGAIDSF
jgi:hypothetical protein